VVTSFELQGAAPSPEGFHDLPKRFCLPESQLNRNPALSKPYRVESLHLWKQDSGVCDRAVKAYPKCKKNARLCEAQPMEQGRQKQMTWSTEIKNENKGRGKQRDWEPSLVLGLGDSESRQCAHMRYIAQYQDTPLWTSEPTNCTRRVH
jgi:hypothetical protein